MPKQFSVIRGAKKKQFPISSYADEPAMYREAVMRREPDICKPRPRFPSRIARN
jgi:hypothetical protein